MKQDKWTQQLHDKLAEHETAAPDNLWADIESAISQQQHRARFIALRRWGVAAAAVVAVMIVSVIGIRLFQNEETGMSNGLESSHSNEVFVDWTTAIDETEGSNETILYPNPTSGIVYLESDGLQEVSVFNLMGQEMMHQSVIDGQATIDMTSLPEGTYFLKLTGTRNEIKKVVKIQ